MSDLIACRNPECPLRRAHSGPCAPSEFRGPLDGSYQPGWWNQALRERDDELERHRALIAELRETGETWASLESDGSRDIDQQVRDGRALLRTFRTHGFGDGA